MELKNVIITDTKNSRNKQRAVTQFKSTVQKCCSTSKTSSYLYKSVILPFNRSLYRLSVSSLVGFQLWEKLIV